MKLLESKVCIITGAAQGIGKGIAERFAADGAIVYACDLREGSMDDWAKECSERNNTRVIPMYFDVSDAAAVKEHLMAVFKAEKHIDALVNNAGVVFNKKIGMIVRQETELMFRINVIAVIEMVQLCSRLMARTGGGSIVNIASVTAVLGSPGQSAYSATKGAVDMMVRQLASEFLDGIFKAPVDPVEYGVEDDAVPGQRLQLVFFRNVVQGSIDMVQ